MEMYLLKSAACLAFLMLFYKLLLEKESIHVFKRYYLLAAVIVSGLIPLISFQTYIEAAPILAGEENWISISEAASESTPNWITMLLWSIYLSGVLLFSGKFLRNLLVIMKRIRKNQKVQTEKISAVLLSEDLPPHTFWNYVFLNKQRFQKGQIPKEVLEHEKAHATQKHSLDILFLELLQIVLWFNPLIYLTKKAVKLNHEFLADNAVLKQGTNTATYQELLLSFSSGELQSSLINSINYSLIKKRFTVMKTRTSKTTSAVKGFLLLPLIAILLYGFSTKEVLLKESTSEETEQIQEKATPEMVAEYNKWAKHYKENEDALVEKQVWERMKYLYSIMTPAQKKESEEFPSLNPRQIITIVEDKDSSKKRTSKEKTEVPTPPQPPVPPVSKDGNIPTPPVPPVPTVGKAGDIPAPPPPPPSPIEAVQGWIEEGAEFFYNGKSLSGEEALKIVQKNNGKNLSVQVEKNNSEKTVKISDKTTGPKTSATDSRKYTNPMKRSETIEHLRELAGEGVVFTYLGKEISVNEAIKHLERKVTLRYSEIDSKRIMKVEDL